MLRQLKVAVFAAFLFSSFSQAAEEEKEVDYGTKTFGYVSKADFQDQDLENVFFKIRLKNGTLGYVSFEEIKTTDGRIVYTMDVKQLSTTLNEQDHKDFTDFLKKNPKAKKPLMTEESDANQCWDAPGPGGRDYDIELKVYSDRRCQSICIRKYAVSYYWYSPRNRSTDYACQCFYN